MSEHASNQLRCASCGTPMSSHWPNDPHMNENHAPVMEEHRKRAQEYLYGLTERVQCVFGTPFSNEREKLAQLLADALAEEAERSIQQGKEAVFYHLSGQAEDCKPDCEIHQEIAQHDFKLAERVRQSCSAILIEQARQKRLCAGNPDAPAEYSDVLLGDADVIEQAAREMIRALTERKVPGAT